MLFKVKSVEECRGQVSMFRRATRMERRQELEGRGGEPEEDMVKVLGLTGVLERGGGGVILVQGQARATGWRSQ